MDGMADLTHESLDDRIDRYKAKVWTYVESCSKPDRVAHFIVLFLIDLAAWSGLIYWMVKQPTDNSMSSGQQIGFWICFMFTMVLTFYPIAVRFYAVLQLVEHLIYAFVMLLPLWIYEKCRRAFRLLVMPLSLICTIQKRRNWDEINSCEAQLCKICQRIVTKSALLNGSRLGVAYPVEKYCHHSVNALTSSAQQCHLCNLFLNLAQQCWKTELGSETSEKKSPELQVELRALKIPKGGSSALLRLHCMGLSGYVTLAVDEIHKSPARSQSETSLDTSSEHVIAWARKCISSCKDKHIICQNSAVPSPPTPFRPTRLLRINKEDPHGLRLVDMTEVVDEPEITDESKVDFLALSHCWGGEIDSQLLKNNISEKRKSIDVNYLPRNFQHAVFITRQLGYEYLWIDSLCIIQDDELDWERESTKMGLVYSNAACVISAIGAASSNGGCFFPKDPMHQDVVLRRNADFVLIARSWIREEKMLGKLFQENVEEAPLSSRGWAFQERILAKRVLHFTRNCVLFECNTHRASEYHEDGIPYPIRTTVRGDGKLHSAKEIQHLLAPEKQYIYRKEMIYHSGHGHRGARGTGPHYTQETLVVKNMDYKSQREKVSEIIRLSAHLGMRGSFGMLLRFAGTSVIEKLEFHSSWYEVVEQYSTRRLTKTSDKLMAIAGVAALIQQTGRLTFVAGLWKEALEFNLLWSTTPVERRSNRPVPSWSWSSIDGQVRHHLKHVEDSTPQIPHFDTNGRSKGLESSSKQTGIPNKNNFETSWQNVSLYISAVAVDPSLKIESLIHNATLRLTCRLLERVALNADQVTFLPDIVTGITIPILWYMPVVSFQIRLSQTTFSAPQLHGLVITRTRNDAFERVGYFWTSEKDMITRIMEDGKPSQILFV